jgi:Right handed beta helix region/GH141 insertion domain
MICRLSVAVLTFVLVLSGFSYAGEPDFYLAPNGNDGWTGQSATVPVEKTDPAQKTEGPFASITRAQEAVRQLRAAEPKRDRPIVVEVADGTFFLDRTIRFDEKDSGTAVAPTVFRAAEGAKPIFSGGRVISGWTVGADGRWTAELAEVKDGSWSFYQLFAGDQRRFRPRMPEQGYYKTVDLVEPTAKAKGKGDDRLKFAEGEISADWKNLQDVEVVAFHHWCASRLKIDSVDPKESIVTLHGHSPSANHWGRFMKDHCFLLENVAEALRRPGQWYLDKPTGRLTYLPREGETPETTRVIAPWLPVLIQFEADYQNGKTVDHLVFERLTFAHAAIEFPQDGFADPQAEVSTGGAIRAVGARHVRFVECVVRHIGAYAFTFGWGCRENSLLRCEMVDLGAGGVMIGTSGVRGWKNVSAVPSNPDWAARYHQVLDSTIAHTGRVFPAAIGVWIGHAHHNTVEHCDIYDLYYSATSIGWTWGYRNSLANRNRVGFNHMHTIGQRVLSDMGAVYTLGISPGTEIYNNRIHDVTSDTYGGWGLYTDEGSTDVVMRNNLVYRTKTGGFHQHYGRDNLIENNIFVGAELDQIQRSRIEPHLSFTFRNNIVYWENDQTLLGKNWKDDNFRMESNLYYNPNYPVRFPGDLTLKEWQDQRHQDAGSVVADPGFVDFKKDDFRLKPDSPALKIGFVPFDISQSGRKTPAKLTKDLPPVPRGFDTPPKR